MFNSRFDDILPHKSLLGLILTPPPPWGIYTPVATPLVLLLQSYKTERDRQTDRQADGQADGRATVQCTAYSWESNGQHSNNSKTLNSVELILHRL